MIETSSYIETFPPFSRVMEALLTCKPLFMTCSKIEIEDGYISASNEIKPFSMN